MKIGTLWCRLWGHKFLTIHRDLDKELDLMSGRKYLVAPSPIYIYKPVDFCVRCGIERKELQ